QSQLQPTTSQTIQQSSTQQTVPVTPKSISPQSIPTTTSSPVILTTSLAPSPTQNTTLGQAECDKFTKTCRDVNCAFKDYTATCENGGKCTCTSGFQNSLNDEIIE
ncbi:549_t:CDS:2, partial [Entrophospora sp. SA101]